MTSVLDLARVLLPAPGWFGKSLDLALDFQIGGFGFGFIFVFCLLFRLLDHPEWFQNLRSQTQRPLIGRRRLVVVVVTDAVAMAAVDAVAMAAFRIFETETVVELFNLKI